MGRWAAGRLPFTPVMGVGVCCKNILAQPRPDVPRHRGQYCFHVHYLP